MKQFYVYILSSGRNGTLYIGVTNDLFRRIDQHKSHVSKGFTDKYNVTKLVLIEQTTSIESAIKREKQLKRWNRAWKIELIEKTNPMWSDLSDDF
ncbi:hypothetical protein A2707_01460 [Candidatus Saccharibacteria bacterium RIFCSPHIGHO2_01_FULL_45_15]|nr:MAG: hypothetical protein A2707_01460 [Candidatus Saccharibacteria bacterium RIFCSPHIGHO2_01_FULL_45_15]OGL32862.1 MAG: hypothetical protein A3E76_05860 [Candidatus Saccharibacteria bacterium RIFCSPHIGHO2_12_FULL_44_22]